jgi:hypothetical protein
MSGRDLSVHNTEYGRANICLFARLNSAKRVTEWARQFAKCFAVPRAANGPRAPALVINWGRFVVDISGLFRLTRQSKKPTSGSGAVAGLCELFVTGNY